MPWQWTPQHVDDRSADPRAVHGCVRSTPGNYHGAVRQFCNFGTSPAYGWTGKGTPGLEFEALPGGPVAETVHTGPYAQLPLAYNALFAAIHERGLRPQAPVREAYLVGPAEAPQ